MNFPVFSIYFGEKCKHEFLKFNFRYANNICQICSFGEGLQFIRNNFVFIFKIWIVILFNPLKTPQRTKFNFPQKIELRNSNINKGKIKTNNAYNMKPLIKCFYFVFMRLLFFIAISIWMTLTQSSDFIWFIWTDFSWL